MTTAFAPTDPILSPEDVAGYKRFVLRGLDWRQYRAISNAFAGRHVRLSYDRGLLELMPISLQHSFLSRLFVHFLAVLTRSVGMKRRSCGDMTCDREDLDRGFEPDECFYLTNEPLVRDKESLDFTVDPPPDLGVEIDVTSDSRNRLPLYAALKVPEVWRFKHETITFLRLQPDGAYRPVDRSGFFPFLGPDDIATILHDRATTDEDTLIDRFAAWVRVQVPNAPQSA